MQRVRAWLATLSWKMWAAVAAVAAVALAVLHHLTRSAAEPVRPPPPSDALQNRVAVAEEQALRAKVEASVKAEGKREELAEVAKIDDGAERRRRLAAILRGL